MRKSKELLESAKSLAADAASWADLSNGLFDPEEGLLAKALPTRAQRARFVQSPEYREIRRLLETVIAKSGMVEGAEPTKSGRFVVRLPRSLHAALEQEAREEGVSLNQLVAAKLAVQLRSLTRPSAPPSKTKAARAV